MSVSRISPVSVTLVSIFTQFSSSENLSCTLKIVNNSPFNKTASMAFVASNNKFVNYNLLHKRMRHSTVHALKQIIKCLNSTVNMDQTVLPKFCDACQFGKCHM